MMCACSLAGTSACASCFHNPNSTKQANNFVTWSTETDRTCHLERHGSLANMPSFICWSCSECGFGWHHSENDKQFSYCPNCGAKVVTE